MKKCNTARNISDKLPLTRPIKTAYSTGEQRRIYETILKPVSLKILITVTRQKLGRGHDHLLHHHHHHHHHQHERHCNYCYPASCGSKEKEREIEMVIGVSRPEESLSSKFQARRLAR